ncbi:hypothetical protein JTB14_032617 [Gonioctena quinquepunctata]|nr:hypothetical protein JTB14_032617 [Gonioctena quinquepunctata]
MNALLEIRNNMPMGKYLRVCYDLKSKKGSMTGKLNNSKEIDIMNQAQCINDYEFEQNMKLTPIQEFYKDTNVFITGASGFLGSVLLEKLLRSCPNISTIYILVRDKKGNNMETRIDKLLRNVLFDRLRKECPKYSHKIVGISGDITKEDLGLSPQDKELLKQKINIIFHCAATVKFDENIRIAALTNVRPVRDLLHLANQMSEFKSLIYVSTAYSNCIRKVTEEKFYPPSIDYKALICMSESLSEENMEKLEPMLLKEYPNTYTFTKQIAEDTVKQCGKDLPIGVLRPAIIVSTYREPIRAWVNGLAGPSALMIACGFGILRVILCDLEKMANPVPMDMCVNSMIAAAWDVSNQFSRTRMEEKSFQMPIYNFESNSTNPIYWRQMLKQTWKNAREIPLMKALWHPQLMFTNSYFLYHMLAIIHHWIPAIITDGVSVCFGKSPRYVNISKSK